MLSVSFYSVRDNIDKVINNINNTTCDYIHVDVSDYTFVKNASLSYDELYLPLIKSVKPIEIHLMVEDVKKYVDLYKNVNPEYIIFHVELLEDLKDLIDYIKSFNIKVGLAIDLNTDVSFIKPYINDIDMVLLMSVKAGFGGQKFNTKVFNKIEYLRNISNVRIEVDGGINNTNYNLINSDVKVVGSYITSSDNYQEKINNLINE